MLRLTFEKIFERYKCKAEWKAHDELILASTLTSDGSNQFLVTGGNDDVVAIWNLTGFFKKPSASPRPSNGNYYDCLVPQ